MEYNYKELIEKYMAGRKIQWDWYAERIESNYSDAEDSEDLDNVCVFVEEFVSGHAGQFIMDEFISWFGIANSSEERDMDSIVWNFDRLRDEFTNWLDAHKPEAMEGNFAISFMESDGSLCLYYIMDKKTLKFSEWRNEQGYASWDAMYNSGMEDGMEYDDVLALWDKIKDEYTEHCIDNNYIEEMDED